MKVDIIVYSLFVLGLCGFIYTRAKIRTRKAVNGKEITYMLITTILIMIPIVGSILADLTQQIGRNWLSGVTVLAFLTYLFIAWLRTMLIYFPKKQDT